MPIFEFVKKYSGEVLDLIRATDDEDALNSFLNGSDLLEWEVTIREFEPTIAARTVGEKYLGDRYFLEYILLKREDDGLSNLEATLWLEENRHRIKSPDTSYLIYVETLDEESGQASDEVLCIATCRQHAKAEDKDESKLDPVLDDDIPF